MTVCLEAVVATLSLAQIKKALHSGIKAEKVYDRGDIVHGYIE
jgi:hypothetical protein